MVLRGEATNNTVQLVNSVRLNSNKAQFGGGLFVGFYDNASGNTVTVDNAEVTENEALVETASYTSGGGIFIGFNTKRFFGNTFAIYSSRIVSNEADIGGGISANLVCDKFMRQTDINNLLIEKCTFDNNTAFQGSSAYLSQSGKCNQHLLNTTVDNSTITNGQCSTVLRRNGYVLPCDGSLLVDSMPHVVFHGDITFAQNEISALSLHYSSIELTSSARLQFINNSAYNGAGIQVNSSFIILNTGSSLLFQYNTASGQGGAIYADTCTIDQAGLEDCIFKHSNPSLHPDDWGVSISFVDNQQTIKFYDEQETNAIYVDSVKSYNMFSNPSNSTFRWTGWSYSYDDDDDCTSELSSGPAYFIYTGPLNYTVSSGDYLTDIIHNLTVYDIWGIDITEPDKIMVEIVSGNAYMTMYDQLQRSTLSSSIWIDCYNLHDSSLLYVYPLQFSSVAITVYFDRCKVSICEHCESLGHHGACPSTYMDAELYSDQSCAQGRSGLLCGMCNDSEGYAIAINDPELSCKKCNSSYYGVALFLLLQLVLTLVLLILLAVLHINITDGGLSGFVLFSQIVTLQFPGLGYSSWMPPTLYCFGLSTVVINSIMDIYRDHYVSIPLTVYSIWNLNFLNLDPVPFCISFIDTPAEAILLQYITAACPLVFIAVTYTWIKWYNNGYRLVVYTTRPVHQLLARFWQRFNIQPSLIDTYAGLMLLSYMCFLATSVKLLKFTFVMNETPDHEYYTVSFYYDANLSYFGWPHAVYGVLAILCLLVFVVPLTIVLLFYHLKSFQRCLTRCKLDRPGLHALVDAYQGCFKNSATDGSERRYFAGIYLLFRFFYVAVIVAPINGVLFLVTEICLSFVLAVVIILFRPYKQVFYSFTDFIFVFFLLLLSTYACFGNELLIDSNFIFSLTGFCIMFLPFLGLCLYITYRLLKPCCLQILCKNKTERNAVDEEPDQEQAPLIVPVTTVSVNDFVADSLYADRILNPSEYNEQ